MKSAVEKAIAELHESFRDKAISVEEDGDGGAFVTVHDLEIGAQYVPSRSWVGFRILFQYPEADIYPHYLVPDLMRNDGKALGEGIHLGQQWEWPNSVRKQVTMVSRRSNRLNASVDTAVSKLRKVLDWMRSR